MPNICLNELTVTGPKQELGRFLRAARATDLTGRERPFSLRRLFPIPAHLDTDEPVASAEAESWYTWCWANWGTKWDVMETSQAVRRSEEEYFISFKSAWSPPIAAFTRRIAPDFPALTFSLRFEDPGMGTGGEFQWRGGKPVTGR